MSRSHSNIVSRRKAESYLGIATLIWGGTFIVIKGALDDASPFFFVAVRFLIAALILTPFIFGRWSGFSTQTLRAGIVLGAVMFIGFSTQTVGLQYTSASKSAFITGLAVVFTPFLQMLIEKRMPRPGNLIGVVIVVGGLYLLTSPEGASFNRGDAFTMACAVFFALYIVYLDIFSKKHPILHLVYLQVCTVSLLGFLCAISFETIQFNLTGNLVFALAYTAVLATVVNTSLHTQYQRFTTPTRAALIFTLEPVFAAGIAFVVLHEVLGMQGVVGGAIIVLGLLVSELAELLEKKGMSLWYGREQL
jgi:drug/metabolite transporter (DMT)-like permease